LKTAQSAPDIVCISALPPYALAHAKSAYSKLCVHLPKTDILFGMWNYPGDLDRLAARVGLSDDHTFAINLGQALSEIAARGSSSSPSVPSPQPVASGAPTADPVPTLSSIRT
jgi:hypothetical protein